MKKVINLKFEYVMWSIWSKVRSYMYLYLFSYEITIYYNLCQGLCRFFIMPSIMETNTFKSYHQNYRATDFYSFFYLHEIGLSHQMWVEKYWVNIVLNTFLNEIMK